MHTSKECMDEEQVCRERWILLYYRFLCCLMDLSFNGANPKAHSNYCSLPIQSHNHYTLLFQYYDLCYIWTLIGPLHPTGFLAIHYILPFLLCTCCSNPLFFILPHLSFLDPYFAWFPIPQPAFLSVTESLPTFSGFYYCMAVCCSYFGLSL